MRRGYTLIELLVGAALSLLILGLLLALYRFTVHEWSRLSTRVELQQMAAMALGRMADDARLSAPGGVSLVPTSGAEGAALALVRLEDVGTDGQQLWEERLIVYAWSPAERKLWRRSRAASGTSKGNGPPLKLARKHPSKLPPPLMRLVASERDDGEVCVASGVVEFEASLAGSAETPAQPLSLRLVLEKPILHNRPERFELSRDVFLRNEP